MGYGEIKNSLSKLICVVEFSVKILNYSHHEKTEEKTKNDLPAFYRSDECRMSMTMFLAAWTVAVAGTGG